MQLCMRGGRVSWEVEMTNRQPTRRISIRSVKRNPPDLSKLGRALIDVAAAEAEAKAQAEHNEAARQKNATPSRCEDIS